MEMERSMGSTRIWLAAIAALAALATPAAARSNTVTDWNGIATTAIVATAAQPPQAAILSLGMVQGAVYDAVNGIERSHRPYLVAPPAERWASQDAAAATAAFRVLITLFPGQAATLQPQYDAALGSVPDERARAAGVVVGEAAAAAMLAARQGDGRGGPFTFVFGTTPGVWRQTPPTFALDPAPWVANVRPFLVPSAEMLRTDGPDALTSPAYARDVAEVKEIGSLTSTTRTPDQTEAAIFWQDHGVAMWYRVLRALAGERQLGLADSARLYAMTSLAGADGAIGCWNDKYHWNFWRPITAVREAATDGNPKTEADASWLPLFDPSTVQNGTPLSTPPFPDHPSGHGCISGAIAHTMRAFFHSDRVAFDAFSNRTLTTRHFDRLSDALQEIVDARVWGGIHFRNADEQGAQLGREVARYLRHHYFQPVHRQWCAAGGRALPA
jgi:hypothetical protein